VTVTFPDHPNEDIHEAKYELVETVDDDGSSFTGTADNEDEKSCL